MRLDIALCAPASALGKVTWDNPPLPRFTSWTLERTPHPSSEEPLFLGAAGLAAADRAAPVLLCENWTFTAQWLWPLLVIHD